MGKTTMRQIEKYAYMGSIDHHWIEHIDQIDSLREGVRLRGYAQRDPLVEFKNEAFTMFEGLIGKIDGELSRRLFRVGVARPPEEIPLDRARTNVDKSDAIGLATKSADETAVSGQPLAKESHVGHTHGDVKRKKVPEKTPDPMCKFIKRLIVRDVLSRPNWHDEDLFETFREIRKESFGRLHSGMKKIKGLKW